MVFAGLWRGQLGCLPALVPRSNRHLLGVENPFSAGIGRRLHVDVWAVSASPFRVAQTRQLNQLASAIFIMIAISGVIFLAVPSEPAFQPVEPESWKTLIWVADTLNLHYNCVPSLHVGLSVACVAAFTRYTAGMFSLFLWLWAAAVAVSTMLLHQHHLIDVLTGWWLALFCVRRSFPNSE